jgi:hypothetical protein
MSDPTFVLDISAFCHDSPVCVLRDAEAVATA